MRIRLIPILALLCFSGPIWAQQKQALTASSSTCTAAACLEQDVGPSVGGATLTLSGTWSATVQFEASGDGGATWVAINATPSNSTTAVTSATGNGVWQVNLAGYTGVRMRVSSFASGPAVASIIFSLASARANGGGGAGSGTVTSVATTAPLSGGTCTTTCTLSITANGIANAQLAVVQTRRVCDIIVGDTTGSAITNGQLGPQKRLCYVPAAATIVEMDVAADAGTPNVIVAVNHAGSDSNIVSSALATAGSGGIACSNTGGTTGIDGATTCSSTLQNTSVAAGDYLELVSGTAGGTAKLMSIHVVYIIS